MPFAVGWDSVGGAYKGRREIDVDQPWLCISKLPEGKAGLIPSPRTTAIITCSIPRYSGKHHVTIFTRALQHHSSLSNQTISHSPPEN